MKLKRIIFLILIILICGIIFYFSNQIADASSQESGRIVKFIAEIIPSIKNMNEVEKLALMSNVLQPIVRKIAHFSIYTLLGICTMNYMSTFKRNTYQRAIFSLNFGILYAISDEIHQLFVLGRSCEFRDMCIDSLGVLSGIFIAILIIKFAKIIINKIKNNKNKNEIKEKEIQKVKLGKDINVMFISSTGGHFDELMQLNPLFNKCNYHIVTEKTPTNKNLKKEKYGNKINYLVYGTKKTPIKYVFILMINCFISLFIYIKTRPQIVITTGTHTAGPMCCIAKILGSKVIYIETFANRTTKTSTGKLLYNIADVFIVQWDEMLKVYPKAKCFGWIY